MTQTIHRNAVDPASADWPYVPTDARLDTDRDPDRTVTRYPVRHLLRHFEGKSCSSSTR